MTEAFQRAGGRCEPVPDVTCISLPSRSGEHFGKASNLIRQAPLQAMDLMESERCLSPEGGKESGWYRGIKSFVPEAA